MACVRDRLWLWGHEAGSHDLGWSTPKPSRMTPVEGALYMGVPNMIFIRYGSLQMPFDQYVVPFRALDRVVWSIVGAGGATAEAERGHVLELAARNPNFTGVMMDDFFKAPGADGEVGNLTVEQLRDVQARLTISGRKLDLWVVLYKHQLDDPVGKHLEHCDNIAFWTWEGKDLAGLEANFEKLEKLVPKKAKVLGCYMWDYGEKHPMPLDRMEHQCEMGLRWLREGRIEGMIFLASCICDLELETVEWTRNWISRVGDQPLY